MQATPATASRRHGLARRDVLRIAGLNAAELESLIRAGGFPVAGPDGRWDSRGVNEWVRALPTEERTVGT
jgi:hypothetical protein